MINHKRSDRIDALSNAAIEGPRPPVTAIVYSSRKFSRTWDTLSILRYGPLSVDSGGQCETPSAGAG
jgi:hypothetical protein